MCDEVRERATTMDLASSEGRAIVHHMVALQPWRTRQINADTRYDGAGRPSLALLLALLFETILVPKDWLARAHTGWARTAYRVIQLCDAVREQTHPFPVYREWLCYRRNRQPLPPAAVVSDGVEDGLGVE